MGFMEDLKRKAKGKLQQAQGELQQRSGKGIKGRISKMKGKANETIADAKIRTRNKI